MKPICELKAQKSEILQVPVNDQILDLKGGLEDWNYKKFGKKRPRWFSFIIHLLTMEKLDKTPTHI